ncbi:hypothetical protein SUGI_0637490 [Cryptomeria japonica]|nr:hypothetical protein SUGI_0637490 [Cryptomeria japonica]
MICIVSKKVTNHEFAETRERRVNIEETSLLESVRERRSHDRRSLSWVMRGSAIIVAFLILGGFIKLLSYVKESHQSCVSDENELSYFHRWFVNAGSNLTIATHLKELTRTVHVAGTPQDMQTATYVQNFFQKYGLSAHSVDYKVLLSFPVSRSLSLFSPSTGVKHELCLDSGHYNKSVMPPFHAWSPSGTLVGEMVYVNYGGEKDYRMLAKMGVNVSGAIAIARYGDIYRGTVVRTAAKFGAIAAIMYSDPQQFGGNGTKGFFPKSKWLPLDGVQFGTVMQGMGDPSTPGWPSTENSERVLDISDRFPSIPSVPISANEAQQILMSLSGPAVPAAWRGSLDFHGVGRGPGIVNFTYVENQTMSTIRNVLAVIRGSEEPDRYVILGNHRDAWTYGAVDPNSGTAALLELARKFGALLGMGWQPRRTIILCSWDAEEYGMIGSTEWVEENLGNLGAKAVAYLNVDCAVQGSGFFASATPQLDDLLIQVTKQIKDPDSTYKNVYDSWIASRNQIKVKINRLGGGGSDFVAFLQHVGVPSIDMYFGESYPVYHTIYDSFTWMEKFGDPYFHRHVAVSAIWGLLALRLSDECILPFNYLTYVNELQRYTNTIKQRIENFKGMTIKGITLAIKDFTNAAKHAAQEAKVLKEGNKGGYKLILRRRDFNDRLILTERSFLDSKGLKGRTWFKHLVYAPSQYNEYHSASFPGVVDAMESKINSNKKEEEVQHEIWRVSRRITEAAITLDGKLT